MVCRWLQFVPIFHGSLSLRLYIHTMIFKESLRLVGLSLTL